MKLTIKIINRIALFFIILGAFHIGLTVVNIRLIPALCLDYIPAQAIYTIIGACGLWGVYMLFQKN